MGVKTPIELCEVNRLFPSYSFVKITPTLSGIIDTTYILHTKLKSYILKRYERDIEDKIALDIELLKELKSIGLNVSLSLDSNSGWHIYERLEGKQPTHVRNYHIQALARFLAKMHSHTLTMKCDSNIIIEDEVTQALKYSKINYFSYYKRFEFLKNIPKKPDAIIHGDIFKDNTLFHGTKIGVIDFIDSSHGTFAYDVAVSLVGFDVRRDNNYFINLFLKNYNQHAPKKLQKSLVIQNMKVAANLFALKRVYKYKNTFKAKELLSSI